MLTFKVWGGFTTWRIQEQFYRVVTVTGGELTCETGFAIPVHNELMLTTICDESIFCDVSIPKVVDCNVTLLSMHRE